MAGGEPEKGDKVSWNWGAGAPGGEVAETKTEGEIAITSKRGNKIKKNAEPDNPAVHVKRSGNDVVKKASELNIEKKASGAGDSKKDDSKKRKADKDADNEEEEDKHEKNEDGKEVRKGGKTPSKAGKGAKKAKKSEEPEEAEVAAEASKKEEPKANGEKKGRGRPKATEASGDKKVASKEKKPKKEATARPEGDMVSTRTRSSGKSK